VWNWAVRKIELDGRDGVRYSSMERPPSMKFA